MSVRNDKKNPFFTNVGLFSTSYFLHRVQREKDYPKRDDKEVQALWTALRTLWTTHEERLTSKNVGESDTEKFWFDKVLPLLGFSFVTKTQLRGSGGKSQKFPDYTLFRSEQTATEALNADVEHRYVNALCLLEGKRFGLDLEQVDPDKKNDDARLPCVQIAEYLKDSEVDWGILSNGKQWQIFYRRGQYNANRFFEMNLLDMLCHPEMPSEFCTFLYCFSFGALEKDKEGRCRLDRIFDQSKRYGQEVGESFFGGCANALRLVFEQYQKSTGCQKDHFKSQQCHQASLILLFRLIAIRYLEDRGVLPTLSGEYRSVSLDVIRLRIEKDFREGKKASTQSTGVWQRLRILFQDVNSGKFGIYPGHKGFESDLFDIDFDAFYRDNPLSDAVLSQVIDWICRGSGKNQTQIDFFDLGVEKIGDVYNELLALRIVQEESGKVILAESTSKKKELGSYFTHPKLTRLVSDGVLEYLRERYHSQDEWLKITFCDNSCGSGHFIRQLIEDISYDLYISPSNNGTATQKPLDQNAFRRMLAQHSAFGIDKDINAVWLTKLSLWLQTAETGKPFVFLDSHIVHGDSILSTTEIPTIEDGDEKKLTELFKKLRVVHSEDKRAVISARQSWTRTQAILKKYNKFVQPQRSLFDTNKDNRQTYFSYALTFPDVFLSAEHRGFTIVVGNPPWETVKPKVQDFYKMKTGKEAPPKRKELDAWLESSQKIAKEYESWSKDVASYSKAIRESGYKHQAGEVYTYAYFIERSVQTLQAGGFLSYIVKLGIYGDEKTSKLRHFCFRENTLRRMWLFKNNKVGDEKLFPRIDPNEKFAVFDLVRRKTAKYTFEAKQIESMEDISREFPAWASYSIPDRLDENNIVEVYDNAERKGIAEKLGQYQTVKNSGLKVGSELHMTNDRRLFTDKKNDLPIYTGYELKPYTLAPPESWCRDRQAFEGKPTAAVKRIGVNNILPNSRRKLRASPIPAGVLTANSILVVTGFKNDDDFMLSLAGLNALLTEYVLRPKLSNLNLNNFRLEALPLPLEFADNLRAELVGLAKKLSKRSAVAEDCEEYKQVEALLAVGYGLSNAEIRAYLGSFDDTPTELIEAIVDYAEIYRKKFRVKVAAVS